MGKSCSRFTLQQCKVELCYVVASWWFDVALSDRRLLERVQAQEAHRVAGLPKAAKRQDALREARLKPIHEVGYRRALEH
ncbi:hypothetical protein ERJ75_000264400 [Trypanosoma vivax]|nr:hypothetical protein ERJ75_000264400 [Trypanosoma vivax]